MADKDLTYKFLKTFKNKKDPIDDVRELDKGENGILKTLFIYEVNEQKSLTPGELCSIQQVTSGRVASTLKSLERKAYIIRKADAKDKRKTIIKLTESGKKMAKKVVDGLSSKIQKIINKLGERDAKEFLRIFNRLID